MINLIAFFMPGPLELSIVLLVVLLLFGKRIPGVMHSIGRSIVEFKKGAQETPEIEDDGSPAK